MILPITLVSESSSSRPMIFRWSQKITTPFGDKTVKNEGPLPVSLENAVAELIVIATRLQHEVIGLRRINTGFADRIAAQSESLSKVAEKSNVQTSPPVTPKKK